eukprot:8872289-Ditylum_brightwellii.AAC.1
MTYPDRKLTPNNTMNEHQKKVVAAFVDELIDLEALDEVPTGAKLMANEPLKVIPKPGQPGEWRVLSDMRKGGQNDHIAADMVHYPRVPDILPRLTPG